MHGRLLSFADAVRAIHRGRVMYVAGDATLLARLPAGHWIGGSTPYFVGERGGECNREQLFVAELPAGAGMPSYCQYNVEGIAGICADAPEHGFTLLIVPAFSAIHQRFAHDAPSFDGMYLSPLVGWVAGVHLQELERQAPQTAFGPSGELSTSLAVAVHVPMPADQVPELNIINLFEQGKGADIRFEQTGFQCTEALVDGHRVNLARWLDAQRVDHRLPLVANYSGAMINVSIRRVDPGAGVTEFYAPVFADLDYRIARPIPPYGSALREQPFPAADSLQFCCNCVLNYLYGELEGERIDPMHGPVTFGEIAYQLVNQTLVYLERPPAA